MNRSMPGLPVHHQLPEFTKTHVHRVSDAIQPSHPLSSPSPPAPNTSQNQSLFQWVNSSHEVAKGLEFQPQHHSFRRNPRADLLQNGLVGSPCSPRDSQESSPTPQSKSINSSALKSPWIKSGENKTQASRIVLPVESRRTFCCLLVLQTFWGEICDVSYLYCMWIPWTSWKCVCGFHKLTFSLPLFFPELPYLFCLHASIKHVRLLTVP